MFLFFGGLLDFPPAEFFVQKTRTVKQNRDEIVGN